MKKAFVTGASSGIGLEVVWQLAFAGYDVDFVARREDRVNKIQNDLRLKFPAQKFSGYVLDLQDSQKVDSFFASYSASGISVLVNNAGLAKGTSVFQNASMSEVDTMMQTNVNALMRVTRALLPEIIKTASSGSSKVPPSVINLGSVAGKWVYPGGAVYCATKFAVRAFSEGLRMDLIGKGVRVCLIEPGMVETEFSEVRFNQDTEKAKAVYQGMTPLVAEDIARSILWVLDQPKHVNIQELVIFPTDQAAVGQVHRST